LPDEPLPDEPPDEPLPDEPPDEPPYDEPPDEPDPLCHAVVTDVPALAAASASCFAARSLVSRLSRAASSSRIDAVWRLRDARSWRSVASRAAEAAGLAATAVTLTGVADAEDGTTCAAHDTDAPNTAAAPGAMTRVAVQRARLPSRRSVIAARPAVVA
jgi:hypothetical protein